jgi:large subunit ribosomal protein L17
MFRNMVTSLFKHDRIRTTDAKAKELRRWADNLITLAKRGDLHARRQALAIVRERAVVHKLFNEAGERFGSTSGGYTRIVRLGSRPGDAAPISLIELISKAPEKKKRTRKKKKTAAAEKQPTASKQTAEKKAEKTETAKETKEAEASDTTADAASAEETSTASLTAADKSDRADAATEPPEDSGTESEKSVKTK